MVVFERERAMDGRQRVVVETGLDERAGGTLRDGKVVPRTRHARSTLVAVRKRHKPKAPELGDGWCPLTVRARLERLAYVFRQVPHDPDTRPAQVRSNMPEPVREIFKDQPGEPMRIPVDKADLDAAKMVLNHMITLHRLWRIVAWSIANRIGDRRLGAYLHKDRRTAATLKQKLLARLSTEWPGAPDEIDIADARDFLHRKFD